MNDNYPRFRTAHEAGKYIAAQLYDYARGLNAEEFGAVTRYVENPAYQYAQFEVRGDKIVDLHEPKKAESHARKTSSDWYADWSRNGRTILFADGWLDVQSGIYDYWNFEPITQEEFLSRVSKSILMT